MNYRRLSLTDFKTLETRVLGQIEDCTRRLHQHEIAIEQHKTAIQTCERTLYELTNELYALQDARREQFP